MSEKQDQKSNQLETLRKMLLSIGALTEESVDKSLKSLINIPILIFFIFKTLEILHFFKIV